MKFKLTILGSGGAIPTIEKRPTSQFLNIQERRFLIDCGEGTQIQLRKFGCRFTKIDHIFISHLHGDHYLGLIGLLSTFNLLGRINPIYIYAPKELEEILEMHFKISGKPFRFNIEFHPLNFKNKALIFEDNVLQVFSFPVSHSVPCCGFLFKEVKKSRNIIKTKIQNKPIPFEKLKLLKEGKNVDFNNEILKYKDYTKDSPKPRSYAYCADTQYDENLLPIISNVDLLYHEATFLEQMKERAKKTQHSTAKDAATMAKEANTKRLIIGHFSARYNEIINFEKEAKTIFENTIAVNDGDIFEI